VKQREQLRVKYDHYVDKLRQLIDERDKMRQRGKSLPGKDQDRLKRVSAVLRACAVKFGLLLGCPLGT
jgi:hypothetical protein